MRRGVVAFVLLPLACAGARTEPPPKTVRVAEPRGSEATLAADPPRPTHAGTPFPATPLTDLANSVTNLVRSVLDGKTPPSGPLPLERYRSPEELIRSDDPPPRGSEIDVVAFALELDIVLKDEAPAPVGPSGTVTIDVDKQDGSLRVIPFLSRTGLKIAGLEARSGETPKPLPAWLDGVARFGGEVLDHARSGSLSPLVVGEAERPLFGDDAIWKELQKDLPKPDDLRRAAEITKNVSRPLGYRVRGLFLVGRDGAGKICGFELRTDEVDGQTVLDAAPLIRVKRFKPREGS